MATEQQSHIHVDEERVRITELEVTDPSVVEYVQGFDEEDRAEAVTRALQIGLTTMELAETTEQEEFVERKFQEMRHDLETEIERIQEEVDEKFGDDGHVPTTLEEYLGNDGTINDHIEEAFGEDGAFVERLDEELGEDGERIREALDPDTEGTPTHRLKQSLQDQIDRLRDKIEEQATEEETREELKQRTTLKGEDFEKTVEGILEDLVYQTSDEVEFTGEETGEIGNRKVGDFVLTLNDTGQRIVIEAKSDQSYSQPRIKDELDDAIENRDADYGIIVFETAAQVPKKVGMFHEFDNERLCVALSETDDDDVERGFLRIAANWGRARAVQTFVDSGSELDTETVQTSINEIEDSIRQFTTIRKKTTSIKSTANEIDEQLDAIEDDVNAHVRDIRTELTADPD
jgi:hypothetical protein